MGKVVSLKWPICFGLLSATCKAISGHVLKFIKGSFKKYVLKKIKYVKSNFDNVLKWFLLRGRTAQNKQQKL